MAREKKSEKGKKKREKDRIKRPRKYSRRRSFALKYEEEIALESERPRKEKLQIPYILKRDSI